MKRILIFSIAYYPFVGGAEVAVREITKRIPDTEFFLITSNLNSREKREEVIDNVRVFRIGFSGRIGKLVFPFLATFKAIQLHDQYGFSAVWSIMANYAGFAALFFITLRPRVKFILTLQEGDSVAHIKRRVWFVYPIFLHIFKRAHVIQTISHYLAQVARDFGATAPIHVIPNGVDTELFAREYSADELDTLREKLGGKQSNDVWLVTTSRLTFKNGIDTVIRALLLLPAHIKFVILGGGELEDELKALAKKLGVSDRVQFVGFVPHDDMPKYLKVSDIFIRTSRSEGLGNSFIEAMAAGLPVIATPVGGIIDFLIDGETGLFAKVDDPESVKMAVMKITTDPVFRQNIVSAGQALARSRYDWQDIAVRMNKDIFNG